MNAEEFRKGLIDSLSKLTPEQIQKIHDEYASEGDYDIVPNSQNFWIPSKLDTQGLISVHHKNIQGTEYLIIDSKFLDDVEDELEIYYNLDQRYFTDDGYTVNEFSSYNLDLSKYKGELLDLFSPWPIKLGGQYHDEIIYQAKLSNSSLAIYLQALTKVYGLKSLILNDRVEKRD